MKNLMNKIRKANNGFTLVELIIVIAIIAILTAVAAPQYIKHVDESRWSKDQNNAASLLTAVQVAIVANGSDADTDNDIVASKVEFTKNADVKITGDSDDKDLDAALKASLGDDYAKMRVTNKDNVAANKKNTYTISISTSGAASGAWS